MILQQSKWESSCGIQEVPRLINCYRWSTAPGGMAPWWRDAVKRRVSGVFRDSVAHSADSHRLLLLIRQVLGMHPSASATTLRVLTAPLFAMSLAMVILQSTPKPARSTSNHHYALLFSTPRRPMSRPSLHRDLIALDRAHQRVMQQLAVEQSAAWDKKLSEKARQALLAAVERKLEAHMTEFRAEWERAEDRVAGETAQQEGDDGTQP